MPATSTIRGAAIGALLALAAASPATGADMRVLESNAPGIAPGSIITSDPTAGLKQGEAVRVLVLSTKETLVFRGPTPTPRQTGGTRGLTLPPK